MNVFPEKKKCAYCSTNKLYEKRHNDEKVLLENMKSQMAKQGAREEVFLGPRIQAKEKENRFLRLSMSNLTTTSLLKWRQLFILSPHPKQ